MADGWWNLDGAITSCVAAYQAIGAASYAASLGNLFNPGTYTLTEPQPTPTVTWNATDGWILAGSGGYLITGIVPDGQSNNWSMIYRFTNATASLGGIGILNSNGASGFYIVPNRTTGVRRYKNGNGNLEVSGVQTSGIMAVAGAYGYLNGTQETGTAGFSAWTPYESIYIGALIYASGTLLAPCYVQAVAVYNGVLTPEEVASLTTLMGALPNTSQALTAADFTLAPVTFDAPVLTTEGGAVDLTASDFTLAAPTFDAPTLANVWITPACRTYSIAAETRTMAISAESRTLVIPAESRGVKILCNSETLYAPAHVYNPLVAKDFTLAAVTFDAPYLGYSISGNAGVAGATVTFGASSVTSGVDGSYRFDGLAAGTKGTVTATKAGYEFYPQRKYIHTMSADVAQDFTATQMTTTYYVRKDGNDTTGDGSTAKPWLTLTKACNSVALTGKVYVKVGTGTYTDTGLPTRNFTGIVVFEPESDALGDVIISSAATSNFVIGNLKNVRFRKLDFEEGANVTNWNVLFTEGVISNIDLIDCRIARNVSTSIDRGNLYFNSTTATNVVIDGCDFPVSQNSPAAIEVVTRTSVSGLTITGCTFPESTGGTTYYSAISLKSSVGTGKFIDNVEISNLTISDLKHVIAVYIGHDTAAQTPITNVNMYDCTVTGDDHVVAFEFGVDGALIDHCTVNAVGTYGFVIKESDDVEISNCTVNSGTNSAIYFKAARGANAHHNTITATQGYGFRLAANLAPNPDTKCSNWIFQNNTVNVSGTGKALIIGGDADDSGGGVCDYNTYQNNSGLGSVRNDADVQSLAELQAAWADYDVTTNDSHSSVI